MIIETLNILLVKKNGNHIKVTANVTKIDPDQYLYSIVKTLDYFLCLDECYFTLKIAVDSNIQTYLIYNNTIFIMTNDQPEFKQNISTIKPNNFININDYKGILFIGQYGKSIFKHRPDKKIYFHFSNSE